MQSIQWLIHPTVPGADASHDTIRADSFRRAATRVEEMLKGAKPADLPMEQPTLYYMYVDLKTAKALGFSVPHSIMLRADTVIE